MQSVSKTLPRRDRRALLESRKMKKKKIRCHEPCWSVSPPGSEVPSLSTRKRFKKDEKKGECARESERNRFCFWRNFLLSALRPIGAISLVQRPSRTSKTRRRRAGEGEDDYTCLFQHKRFENQHRNTMERERPVIYSKGARPGSRTILSKCAREQRVPRLPSASSSFLFR